MVKCKKCGHDPVDQEAIANEHANEVAAAIDKEAFDMILRRAMIETARSVKTLERNMQIMREEMNELNKKRS